MKNKHLGSKTNTEIFANSPGPPARRNFIDALRRLLEDRVFNSITTAEIARAAKANEALIYRYFGNKRGLLHAVLDEYLNDALIQINHNLGHINDPIEKLKSLIRDTFEIYNQHRVFAQIILVEVRNFPDYFNSQTYNVVKRYARLYFDIIQEGINCDRIRSDIPPAYIRDIIIGALEHMVMPSVIFEKTIQPQVYTDKLCQVILAGIEIKKR